MIMEQQRPPVAGTVNRRSIHPMPQAQPQPVWHQLEVEVALDQLGVSHTQGLDDSQARERLRQNGPNELVERGAKSPWRILWEQFTATMVLVLLAAAVLYAAVSGLTDALPILGIVVLFGLLGFVQEYRAERAMAALKRLAVPNVRVRRAGQVMELSACELVPGDIVLLEAGNLVPADSRIIEASNLRVQEAALTGESEPVEKTLAALPCGDQPLGDRRNMLYMGTVITYGRGQAVVTTTGMATELGRIATLLQAVKSEQTPLQRRLDQVGRTVAYIAVAIGGLIFALGLVQGQSWTAMLLTAISVAVAAVPEGLPAVVTITLALGAQRMLRRNALLRKLPAVETLGSVTVIASDKTGTLTENRMTVTVLDLADHRIDVQEQLDPQGRAVDHGQPTAQRPETGALRLLLGGSALCNDAVLQRKNAVGDLHAVGDPTEGALLVAAHRFNLDKDALEAQFQRIAELPFDSERKRMTTVHAVASQGLGDEEQETARLVPNLDAPYVTFTKGAVDGLLEIATEVWTESGREPLTSAWRTRIAEANDQLAQRGMRVLGLAWKLLPAPPSFVELPQLESNLIFVGLIGMIDPPTTRGKSGRGPYEGSRHSSDHDHR